MHGETCTDEVNVSEQESYKIGMRTCSKTQKYWIAHNFFNFNHNIAMLHVKILILISGIELNNNFFKFELPSSHKELHILWWFVV